MEYVANSIFALFLFIVLPYIFGYNFNYKFFKINLRYNLAPILYWFIGIQLISITTLLVYNTQIHIYHKASLLAIFLIGVVFINVIIFFYIIIIRKRVDLSLIKNYFKQNSDDIFPYLLSIIIGFVSCIYYTNYSPFPLIADTDQFVHNEITNLFIYSNQLTFVPPYIPTFNILSGIVFLISGISDKIYSFNYFWSSRFLLFPAYSLFMFILAEKIFNNRHIAILASLVSTSIIIDYVGILTILPKNLIYVLSPLLLYFLLEILDESTSRKLKFGEIGRYSLFITTNCILLFLLFRFVPYIEILKNNLGFILIFLYLLLYLEIKIANLDKNLFFSFSFIISGILFLHNQMGLFISLILILFFILWYLFKYRKLFSLIVVCSGILLPILYILKIDLSRMFNIFFKIFNFPTYLFAIENISQIQKLVSIYTVQSFYLSIIGIIVIYLISLKRPKFLDDNLLRISSILCILILGILSIFFLNMPSSERLLTILTPLIIIVLLIPIYIILRLNLKANQRIIIFSFIILLFITNISNPLDNLLDNTYTEDNGFFSYLEYKRAHTTYSEYEYEAAKWFYNNEIKNSLIIGEGTTQLVITGLSNNYRYITPLNYGAQNDLTEMLLTTTNPEDIINEIIKINEGKIIINDTQEIYYQIYPYPQNNKIDRVFYVISGKTEFWLKTRPYVPLEQRASYGMNIPRRFQDQDFVKFYLEKNNLNLVYEIPDKLYVFELKLN